MSLKPREMTSKEAQDLLKRYELGECNPDEVAALESWYRQLADQSDWNWQDRDKLHYQQQMLKKINHGIDQAGTDRTRRLFWPRYAAVAAAVAALAVFIYFYTAPRRSVDPSSRTAGRDLLVNDIAPGKNGATITLANGKMIELSGDKKGVIVGEELTYADNTPVINTNSSSQATPRHLDDRGDLLNGTNQGPLGTLEMTAETAKGQTYQFTLPDGTHVWLNADSRISFPGQFIGKDRKITLSGEGYFEVAKDKAHPFIVESSGQQVEVLGTHFNINSYADEAHTETTLLEGSVNVNGTILKPNQQSTVDAGKRIKVKEVDVSTVVAWKNNEFTFDGESIEEIMRKVARWYDVKVVYQGDRPKEKFVGGVSRFDNVSKVLKMLESTSNVRFKIEGRTIYVL